MDTSYVASNPQFGLQFECNWSSTPTGLQQITTCTDDLSSCWSDEMGTFSLPLDLEPLPSLFNISPCGNGSINNGYKNESNINYQTNPSSSVSSSSSSFLFREPTKQTSTILPSSDMADVLLSLKHAVIHPSGQSPTITDKFDLSSSSPPPPPTLPPKSLFPHHHHHYHHHHHHNHHLQQQQQQQQHFYHHHHPQLLLSPNGTNVGNGSNYPIAADQNFGLGNGGSNGGCIPTYQHQPATIFPASMSVNVSMNMTMHSYPPPNGPNGYSTDLTCPQVQWSTSSTSSSSSTVPNPQQSTIYQNQGLLSPNNGTAAAAYGGTYSFTADFRAPPPSNQTILDLPPLLTATAATTANKPVTMQMSFMSPKRRASGNSINLMDDDGQKPNICRICGKSYARPSTLKTHLRTHSGEKPFRCGDCNKSFSQAANLTAHVRTHSGEKPFRCPVCDRRFSQSSSVTTHMRTHSGERPYRCRLCKKAFSDSSTLTKHLRIHSGEKPYECKLCLLRFSQSGNLNRHMRVHGTNNNNNNNNIGLLPQ